MTDAGIAILDSPEQPTRWRVWLALGLIALLGHSLVFISHVEWNSPAAPPRVEVQQVDPAKLEAIRRQWRKKQEQSLLLNKDKNRPSEKEAPPDAKFYSDRNIRVEKEQRARDTQVVRRPGTPQARTQPPQPPAQSAQPKEAPSKSRTAPKLGNLGVPFDLKSANTPKNKQQARNQAQTAPSQQQGGEQYIDDKSLPVGSENILNAQESVYYSFYARLYEAIGPIWQSKVHEVPHKRQINEGNYSTVVDVVMDRNGNLLGIRQQQASGIAEFDAAVDSSWRRIGRFPNPPDGLVNENGEVHTGWTFTVQVGAGFNIEYLPPERNY